MTNPNFSAETDDPGSYDKRQEWIDKWMRESKEHGCNVTRAEIEGGKLIFKGWYHPASAPQVEGISFDPPENTVKPGFEIEPITKYDEVTTVDLGLITPPEFQATIPEQNDMVDLEPYPALSPNRMYGNCLRFIYRDGRIQLQQKWIIPQEGLRVPRFEWRDVELEDSTEP